MLKLSINAVLLIITTAAFGNYIILETVPSVGPAQDLAYYIDAFDVEGWVTYDLVVDVDEGDSWSVAHIYMCPYEGDANVFWKHPSGVDSQPAATMLPFFGLLAYDSFWTFSEEYPNPDVAPDADATILTPGAPAPSNPVYREAERHVDQAAPNVGSGRHVIARITVQDGIPLCVNGESCFDSTACFPWPLYLPEGCECGGGECPGYLTFDNRIARGDLAVQPANDGDVDFDGEVDLSDPAAMLTLYGE